jgi:predicted glycosyltransferase
MLLRILLYCHNVQGLGHIVRTLQIAAAAGENPDCDCTVVTGCRHLAKLAIPQRVRLEPLPPVRKEAGRFVPACEWTGKDEIMKARAKAILAICRRAEAHAVLVDHHPLGFMGEMLPTLLAAANEGWPTRFVWGIPYLEGAIGASREPSNPRIMRALSRYESAIAYVDEETAVFSQCPKWLLPERRAYVGEIVEPPLPPLPKVPALIVIACGGGTHAQSLCELVMQARRVLRTRTSVRFRLVTGPMADLGRIAALLKDEPGLELRAEGTLRESVRDAAVVVSSAGYNSSAFLLRTDLPVIFVPVVRDQHGRCRRLVAMDGVWIIDPSSPAAARSLASAIDSALGQDRATRKLDYDSGGATRAARWVQDAALRTETLSQGIQAGVGL